MHSSDTFDESKSAFRTLLDQVDLDPTEGQFATAPVLGLWQVALAAYEHTVLMRHVTGHPILNGPFVTTSPLLRLNRSAGWARSLSRCNRWAQP